MFEAPCQGNDLASATSSLAQARLIDTRAINEYRIATLKAQQASGEYSGKERDEMDVAIAWLEEKNKGLTRTQCNHQCVK